MRLINTLFLLFLTSSLLAQEPVVFRLIDAKDNKPLSDALIVDPFQNTIITSSNEGGYFVLYESDKELVVRLFGYQNLKLDMAKYDGGEEKITLLMNPVSEVLDEVGVSAKPFKKKPLIRGFEFWQGGIVALSKHHNNLLITDFELNLKYKKEAPLIDGKRAISLYKDVMDNIYLVGKQNVMQLYITDSVVYTYQPRNIHDFNRYIKDLKLVLDNGDVVYRNVYPVQLKQSVLVRDSGYLFELELSHPVLHNCGSEFILYSKEGGNRRVYWSVDTNKMLAADEQFKNYVKQYILADGSPADRSWGSTYHSYKTIFAKYQEVPMYNYGEDIIVFDALIHKLVKLDSEFNVITTVDFDFKESSKNIVAIQDEKNDRIWLFSRHRGHDEIYELEEGLNPGSSRYHIGTFVRNLRLHDNVVFFQDDNSHIAFYIIPKTIANRR